MEHTIIPTHSLTTNAKLNHHTLSPPTGMLERFRVGEDVPIESAAVAQALDKVQAQVEAQFRAVRQQVSGN